MTQSTTELETDGHAMELFEIWRNSLSDVLQKCTSGQQMFSVGGIALANLICCFIACTTTDPAHHARIIEQITRGATLLLESTDWQTELQKAMN